MYTQTDPFNYTLTFGYDNDGNVLTVADSAGGTVTSIYNADNQLSTREFATTAGGTPANVQLRMDLTYTPAGQIYTEKRYSDTRGTNLVGETQFTYDPAGNVSEIKHTNAAATVLLDYQYQWDSADRLSSETDTYSGTPTTTTYGYDASNELTSATYTYDANGNRTMAGYQTGANNELLSDGTWNYAYLCPCQLAGGDFSRFCERFSQGTGWCSLSQRSMAASQIGWRVAAAHRSSWFPADRQWKQRYTFFSKCGEGPALRAMPPMHRARPADLRGAAVRRHKREQVEHLGDADPPAYRAEVHAGHGRCLRHPEKRNPCFPIHRLASAPPGTRVLGAVRLAVPGSA